MGIDRALSIRGWMAPEELQFLADHASNHQRIAEVGSWRGRSTAALADNTNGVVYAIDTWAGSPETDFDQEFIAGGPEWLYQDFLQHAAPNVVPVRMTSVDAAADFAAKGQTFDMIFIDGAHDYQSVRTDILDWYPLLEPGGLLCGHDYFTTVKEAVDELMEARTAAWTIWEMVEWR
jgi:predicted O-methyltransferase YrrM